MKSKKYRVEDVFDFNSSNGIFHACNVSIEDICFKICGGSND